MWNQVYTQLPTSGWKSVLEISRLVRSYYSASRTVSQLWVIYRFSGICWVRSKKWSGQFPGRRSEKVSVASISQKYMRILREMPWGSIKKSTRFACFFSLALAWMKWAFAGYLYIDPPKSHWIWSRCIRGTWTNQWGWNIRMKDSIYFWNEFSKKTPEKPHEVLLPYRDLIYLVYKRPRLFGESALEMFLVERSSIPKKDQKFWVLNPWKLTCVLQINGWKMCYLLKSSLFRGHVSFLGCIS